MNNDMENGICAVKFTSPTCGPCKTLSPSMIKMESEFPSVSFHDINVEEDPNNMAKEFKIRRLPTVVLLKDGKETDRVVGSVLIDALRKVFRTVVDS